MELGMPDARAWLLHALLVQNRPERIRAVMKGCLERSDEHSSSPVALTLGRALQCLASEPYHTREEWHASAQDWVLAQTDATPRDKIAVLEQAVVFSRLELIERCCVEALICPSVHCIHLALLPKGTGPSFDVLDALLRHTDAVDFTENQLKSLVELFHLSTVEALRRLLEWGLLATDHSAQVFVRLVESIVERNWVDMLDCLVSESGFSGRIMRRQAVLDAVLETRGLSRSGLPVLEWILRKEHAYSESVVEERKLPLLRHALDRKDVGVGLLTEIQRRFGIDDRTAAITVIAYTSGASRIHHYLGLPDAEFFTHSVGLQQAVVKALNADTVRSIVSFPRTVVTPDDIRALLEQPVVQDDKLFVLLKTVGAIRDLVPNILAANRNALLRETVTSMKAVVDQDLADEILRATVTKHAEEALVEWALRDLHADPNMNNGQFLRDAIKDLADRPRVADLLKENGAKRKFLKTTPDASKSSSSNCTCA